MRILMTTDTVGGVWTFTQELVTGLLRRGCSVMLVSFGRDPNQDQLDWCRILDEYSGGEFQYASSDAPLEWMDENDRAYEGPAALLLGLADSFHADLLHSNQFCFGALRVGIPKIVTAHSDVFSWAEACRDGRLADSEWLKRYRDLVQRGLSQTDVIIAPTTVSAKALARHFELPAEPRVIRNGRSVPRVDATERKLQAVTAGRLWDEAKDVGLFRDVFSPIPILIAGEARQNANEFPEFPNSVFVGALSQNTLLALFRNSAIYVCTSRYEPFGLTPLEAALCGCAVLARDIESLREVWQEGALYFHDAPSLSALIQQLAANPELLELAQGRSMVRANHFNSDQMTEKYLQLYQTVLSTTVAHAG